MDLNKILNNKENFEIDLKEIGKVIKGIREHKKIKQINLAKKLEISQVHLSYIETGKKDCSNMKLLNKIGTELQIPSAYLILLSLEEKYVPEQMGNHIANYLK
jgi:transcriptional regulator with XRE-family HTH domain